jgi:hypothetical protein
MAFFNQALVIKLFGRKKAMHADMMATFGCLQ